MMMMVVVVMVMIMTMARLKTLRETTQVVDWLQGGSRDASICERMECWIDELKLCFASTEQRAFDKTTCGNKRWCIRGQCLRDSRAPSAQGLSHATRFKLQFPSYMYNQTANSKTRRVSYRVLTRFSALQAELDRRWRRWTSSYTEGHLNGQSGNPTGKFLSPAGAWFPRLYMVLQSNPLHFSGDWTIVVHGCRLSVTELFRSPLPVSGTN